MSHAGISIPCVYRADVALPNFNGEWLDEVTGSGNVGDPVIGTFPSIPEFRKARKVILITDYYLSMQYNAPVSAAGILV